jgi:glucoamylase
MCRKAVALGFAPMRICLLYSAFAGLREPDNLISTIFLRRAWPRRHYHRPVMRAADAMAMDAWIARQIGRSAAALADAISATHLRHRREAFGYLVVPERGSVLASPVSAAWDPEPDYFFHWVRDSAIAMRAVVGLIRSAPDHADGADWRRRFEDFLDFSLDLSRIDGAAFLAQATYRRTTRDEFAKYLRADAELRLLKGDRLLGEPRFNPDGTPDFLLWSRPQYDGPALRALACLDYRRLCADLGHSCPASLAVLLRQDLNFTHRHAGQLCIGPWEEPYAVGRHYHNVLVQLGALYHGADFAEAERDGAAAVDYRRTATGLRRALNRHWSAARGIYLAMREAADAAADPDAAVILAVLEADLPQGRHSALDERVWATLAALASTFADAFPINRDRPADCGAMLGRYPGDRYFGGGGWFATTLAASRLGYRRALGLGRDRPDKRYSFEQGERFMRAVGRFVGPNGEMSEQVDRASGAHTSARNLAWSHAAFLAAAFEREAALCALG